MAGKFRITQAFLAQKVLLSKSFYLFKNYQGEFFRFFSRPALVYKHLL